MSATNLHTINAASVLLERDRATIRRALKSTPPDDTSENGRPKWRLTRIISALAEHLDEKPKQPAPASSVLRELEAVGKEATVLANEVQAGFDKMRAMPDIEERRELACAEVGPKVGRFIDVMQRSADITPDDWGARYISNDICNTTFHCLLELCDWQFNSDASDEQSA
jgi:hypothetical protein